MTPTSRLYHHYHGGHFQYLQDAIGFKLWTNQKKKTPNTTYQTLTTKHYLSNRNDQTKPPTQTKSTKPKHPYQTNQTYQIDLPNSTYQIEPIKPNLA